MHATTLTHDLSDTECARLLTDVRAELDDVIASRSPLSQFRTPEYHALVSIETALLRRTQELVIDLRDGRA